MNAKKEVSGGLAEWSKAAVLKTVEGLSPPKVRILSPPPFQGISARFKDTPSTLS